MISKKSKLGTILLAIILIMVPLFLQSCGDKGKDVIVIPPTTTQGSLLSANDLKRWIDNGYKDDSGNRVVILDTSRGVPAARNDYDSGHIPGAHYVDFNSDIIKTRSDGPIDNDTMVADGPQFDAHIQKYGIDNNTTVVFTGHHIFWTARAYWTYRYWGFPQSHLYVLNGKATTGQSVWTASGYDLETVEPPAPTPATFSVSSWPGNMDSVRASLEDVRNVAEGMVPDAVILDTRNEDEWNGNGIVSATPSQAFSYRFNNAVWRPWELELAGTNAGDPYSVISSASSGNHMLKTAEQLAKEYRDAGLENKLLVST